MRKIRKNVYGNIVGYVGRTRWMEFGDNVVWAEHWLRTGVEDQLAAYE